MAMSRRILKLFMAITVLSVLSMVSFYNGKPPKIVTRIQATPMKTHDSLNASELIQDTKTDSIFIKSNIDKINTVFEQLDGVLRDEKKSIISFLSKPIINNHSFEYFHNPESTCTESPTEILIVVPSAPGNFEKRKRMRNGDYRNFLNITENQTKLRFFIGMTKVNTTQSLIDDESNMYQDIVQESFEDIYHNMRYKAVSMLKWASTFCRGAKYVIRNDDDIVVNLASIVTTVRRTGLMYSNFILGRLLMNDPPARREKSKVFLSKQEYPEDFLPPYALGGLLSYPILTVELLYQAALRVKPIWLDDVYITGICAPKVGVKLLSDPQFVFKHKT